VLRAAAIATTATAATISTRLPSAALIGPLPSTSSTSYRWLPLRLHLIWRDILHCVHYPPMA
jgi:hypothetical protein